MPTINTDIQTSSQNKDGKFLGLPKCQTEQYETRSCMYM